MGDMLKGSIFKDDTGRLVEIADAAARAKIDGIAGTMPDFMIRSAGTVSCRPVPNTPLTVVSHIEYGKTGSGEITGADRVVLSWSKGGTVETIAQQLPETVYKGKLDWRTGLLTIEAEMVDAGDCAVVSTGTTSTGYKYVCLRVQGMARGLIIACNRYAIIDGVPTEDKCIRPVIDQIYIYDNALDLSNAQSSVKGTRFLYAKERTVQLEAREIIAAEGENTFLTSTGATAVNGKNGVSNLADTQLRFVTPEMYGAVGDGAADDTEALRQAMEQLSPVLMTGTYAVGAAIDAKSSLIIGCGAVIKLTKDTNYVLRLPPAARVSGVTIDCGNHSVLYGVYAPDNTRLQADCVEVKNIKNAGVNINGTVYTGASALYAEGGAVEMNNVSAHDVYSLGNGVYADADGAAYGINVKNADLFCANGCRINDCHTMDADGATIWEDGGAIYFTTDKNDSVCRVINCKITNPGKYGLKMQSNNIGVYGTYISNALDDYHAGVALLPVVGSDEPTTAVMHGCQLIDTRTQTAMDQPGTLVNIQSGFADITDCVFDTQMIFAFTAKAQGTSVRLNGCKIKGRCFYGSPEKLDLANCEIDGRVLLNQYQAGAEIGFNNCRITRTGYGVDLGMSGDMYLISNGRVVFDRCRLALIRSNVLDTYGTAQFVVRDCHIEVLTSAYSTYKLINVRAGTTAQVERCTFKGAEIAANCLIYSAGHIVLDGCEDAAKGLLCVTGGTAKIKNMPLPKMTLEGAYEIKNEPYYTDTLPTGTTPEGALVLLAGDGRLYRYSGKAWTAV